MPLEGGYVLADRAALAPHGNRCFISFDGEDFPYHTSADIEPVVVQPKYDEHGYLEEFGYVLLAVLVDGPITDLRGLPA